MIILVAGMETGTKQGITYSQLAEYKLGALTSYFALIRLGASAEKDMDFQESRKQGVFHVIDSGAYALQQPNYILPENELFDLVDDYISFLDRIDGCFAWAADFDVEFSYGLPVAQECLKRLSATNHPICPVWHPERGLKSFSEYCERYDYIGLASQDYKRRDALTFDQFRKLATYAYQHDTKVHIMAGTDLKLMGRVPAYTVDSTSWLSYNRWGNVPHDEPTHHNLRNHTRHLSDNVVKTAIIETNRDNSLTQRGIKMHDYTLRGLGKRQQVLTDSWKRKGVEYK